VATWICHEWNLPEVLAEAIGGHHGDPTLRCPDAVMLIGSLGETDDNDGVDELVERAVGLGISRDRARALVAEGFERGDQLAALFA
jgi:hypothetical protein